MSDSADDYGNSQQGAEELKAGAASVGNIGEPLSDNPTVEDAEGLMPSADSGEAIADGLPPSNLPACLSPAPIDLVALHEADLIADEGFHEGLRQRFGLAAQEGERLMLDHEGRQRFLADPYWEKHVGQRPKLGEDDPEAIIYVVIRRVHGGHSRRRNKRASMLVRACRGLLARNIKPADFAAELNRKDGHWGSGVRAAADRGTQIVREQRRGRAPGKIPSQALTVRRDAAVVGWSCGDHADDAVEVSAPSPGQDAGEISPPPETANLTPILDVQFAEVKGEAMRSPQRRAITVVCPTGSPADSLPETMYLVRDPATGEFVLSCHPDEPLELRLPGSPLAAGGSPPAVI